MTTALTRTRSEIAAAWESFLDEGLLPETVRPEIRRSWLRARTAWQVDPRLARSPAALSPEDALARVEGDAAARVAAGVVARFAERLRADGHVLAWFDADGVCLAVDGNGRTRGRLEDVNFAPGASWAERAVGTNGPGTALLEARPVEVFAAEHFVEAWQCWTCASVPVRLLGRVVGVVDLTSPWTAREPSLLLTAEAVALAIESRLEAELATARSDLLAQVARDALRARDEFLTAASHELRTPLTPLRVKLQHAQRLADRAGQGADAGRFAAALRGADAQVGRLVDVIDGLLETSRVVREPLRPVLEPVDLAGAVRAVADRYRGELARSGCALSVAAQEVVGRWDPRLVEQAIGHLLANAIRYAPGPIAIEVEAEGNCARVLVRDRGPGIAPEDRERIFEPWARAVPVRNVAGFGLGLHAVRRIADAHGGRAGVESAPGQGSTFVLELPLRDAASPCPGPEVPA